MAKDISRTLIIGLGGTGQSVIRDIKKRLFRRYGEIPSLVKFLSIDTDNDAYQDTPFTYYYNGENRETKRYNLQREEFCKISRPGLEVLKTDPNCQNLNMTQLSSIYSLANGIGANGYRVMGRAHFLYNAGTIMKMLRDVVTELKGAQRASDMQANGYHLSNNNVNVYIVASVAGGTGSSSFMDLSRMLQHAGIEVIPRSADSPTDKIFGMFFMPSFFSNKPNTPNVKINTYVALSELDYCLGLNDTEKYPEGCIERENDLNIYAEYHDYKSVRFSNVYLIDEKTKKGHSHYFEEAAGYVASFIAASIAADNTALDSCYSNSTHSKHDVEGKKQLYSGLGYCEIRFDRQNLVQYLLNRQLRDILNAYKTGDSSMDMDRIADAFIADNHLNEGIMSQMEGMEDTRSQLNELTDAIYMLNDKRFTGIVMGSVETGREADSIIQTNKDKYINSITTEATEAVKGFALKKRQILENLDQLLKDRQTQKGFGNFPDLAKRLKWSFENMKLGLEDEMMQHEAKQKQIENDLKKTKNLIKENTGTGFLGIGSKKEAQSAAIRSYRAKVDGLGTDQNPTLMRLKLEMVRKEEAIKIYEEMIKMVESYYKEEEVELGGDKKSVQITGSSLEIQQVFDALKGLLDSENNAYQPSKAAKNETIFVDAYFKDYFESHSTEAFELSDQALTDLDEYVSRIFVDQPDVNNELLAKMRNFVLQLLPEDVLIKSIQREEMSLDQLFVQCFGKASAVEDDHDLVRYPHLGLFNQLETLFDSLWQYEDFRGANSQSIALQCVVGVYDTSDHLLDSNNGYRTYIPAQHSYQFINVGDPDKIVFMLQETAIPAFKMGDAAVWRNEYNSKKDTVYSFSDKRLEEIDMIAPEKLNEMGDIAWAYGWMFGLIASVDKKIQVKPTGAYMTRNKQVKGNSGYYNYFGIHSQKASDLNACHRKFIKDEELFKDIYDQAMAILDTDKPGCIVKLMHWVNDGEMWQNRGKLVNSMDDQERLVIQAEPLYLAKRFARLNSTSLMVTYDDNTQKIVASDSLGVLAEKEKAYQEAKAKNETNA